MPNLPRLIAMSLVILFGGMAIYKYYSILRIFRERETSRYGSGDLSLKIAMDNLVWSQKGPTNAKKYYIYYHIYATISCLSLTLFMYYVSNDRVFIIFALASAFAIFQTFKNVLKIVREPHG